MLRVGHGDVRPERRVRHHHVHRAERGELARLGKPSEVARGELERVHVEDVPLVRLAAITTFIWAARTRNGSKSAPKRFFFANWRNGAVMDRRNSSRRLGSRLARSPSRWKRLFEVRERGDEEAAGAARRVEHALVRLGVEHLHHRA